MTTSPSLGITEISDQQAGAETTHNEAIRLLEVVAHGGILDRNLAAPPGSPTDGDSYIVAASGSGDWSGKDNNIAIDIAGTWFFIAPVEGMNVYLQDENTDAMWNGSAWCAREGTQALTDASTIAWDTSLGTNATVTLSTARTMGTPTNLNINWLYKIIFKQPPAGGGYVAASITWPAAFRFQNSSHSLSTSGDREDFVSFWWDGTYFNEDSRRTYLEAD